MRNLIEYREAVRSFAKEAIGGSPRDLLTHITEAIDNSDWIIYTHHTLAVLVHTDNDDALFEECAYDVLAGVKTAADVYQRIARAAMITDVSKVCLRLADK